MRLILIRHGQSGNNLLFEQTGGSAGRHPDTPLTDLGHVQAQRTAAYLAADPVDLPWQITHLYTSLMTRAVQTARPIADALDLPLLPLEEAYEVGGPFDEDEETGDRSPNPGAVRSALAEISARLRLPDWATDAGWFQRAYEEEHEASHRARRLIEHLRGEHGDDDVVAVVTHGFFTQFLIRELLGIDEMSGWIRIHNTALSLFEDRDWGGTLALRLGWTPHLTGPEISE
ncbi:MAG TPA: histidine phosphatase family protein [Propionibacteriaceae bacterium]|nr:histidine phosphatase family protein [Propionibacteriaceae bacterium]HQE31857.1 histidine phosphatase family protein [Propionibacteriaceae bacterium]